MTNQRACFREKEPVLNENCAKACLICLCILAHWLYASPIRCKEVKYFRMALRIRFKKFRCKEVKLYRFCSCFPLIGSTLITPALGIKKRMPRSRWISVSSSGITFLIATVENNDSPSDKKYSACLSHVFCHQLLGTVFSHSVCTVYTLLELDSDLPGIYSIKSMT